MTTGQIIVDPSKYTSNSKTKFVYFYRMGKVYPLHLIKTLYRDYNYGLNVM